MPHKSEILTTAPNNL